jgi:hypothetical protein
MVSNLVLVVLGKEKKMFVKTNLNNEFLDYPANPWKDYPNDGVTLDFDGGTYKDFIYHKVQISPTNTLEIKPNEYLDENLPKFEDNVWKQVWVIKTMTDEQFKALCKSQLQSLKDQRNNLLHQSDWTQLQDIEHSPRLKIMWAEYRRQLRHCFEDEADIDLFNFEFPEPPPLND